MSKLTALIPCKNEAANIAACVRSVQAVADEILIADSGSTDATLDIVRGLGDCRVIEHPWTGYARFKNWAIPQASHDWVLIVDADERATEKLAREIRATLASAGDNFDGYWIPRLNYFMGHPVRFGAWRGDSVLRLIRRDRARYAERAVHEEIDLPQDRVGRLDECLQHYTYWSWDQCLEKLNRYAKLDAGQRFERGKRTSAWRLLSKAPFRFLRDYLLRLGVLDGRAGLMVSAINAYYSFMKEARLWELAHARQPAAVDPYETADAQSQRAA